MKFVKMFQIFYKLTHFLITVLLSIEVKRENIVILLFKSPALYNICKILFNSIAVNSKHFPTHATLYDNNNLHRQTAVISIWNNLTDTTRLTDTQFNKHTYKQHCYFVLFLFIFTTQNYSLNSKKKKTKQRRKK